jgi:D-glutamate cyclase
MLIDRIRDVIQVDIANRGLQADPHDNLVTACPDDFRHACQSIAESRHVRLGIVTGFYVPSGQPPAAETDGPLGAVFLARALVPLGISATMYTDQWCAKALEVGLREAGLAEQVPVQVLSEVALDDRMNHLTHLLALERVGPSHTLASIKRQPGVNAAGIELFAREVPQTNRDRCHSMHGRDNTEETAPAHLLFEAAKSRNPRTITIGIGDGGNEIGMGKIPWATLRRNVANGAMIACRVPADLLIVCGISNWGAYGLAAGIRLLRNAPLDDSLFDSNRECAILQAMISEGPLVDGVTGRQDLSVDGVPFDRYADPLRLFALILGDSAHA